jgi:hypothetical protein
MYCTSFVKLAKYKFLVKSLQRNPSYSRRDSLLFMYSAVSYFPISSKITTFVANYSRVTGGNFHEHRSIRRRHRAKIFIAGNIKFADCWIDAFVSLCHVHSNRHTHIKQKAVKRYSTVHVLLPCSHVTTTAQTAVITGFFSNCQSSLIPDVHH